MLAHKLKFKNTHTALSTSKTCPSMGWAFRPSFEKFEKRIISRWAPFKGISLLQKNSKSKMAVVPFYNLTITKFSSLQEKFTLIVVALVYMCLVSSRRHHKEDGSSWSCSDFEGGWD